MTIAKKKTEKEVKTITKKATAEELILGGQDTVVTVEPFNYEDANVKYIVTVAKNGEKIKANGSYIETYIGCCNKIARENLINGVKKVECYEPFTKDLAYTIEVVE